LIENLPVGVLKQAPDASIIISNNAALELLGLTEEQLLGKTSFDPGWNVIHEDGSPFPGHTHPVPTAIATGKSVKNVIMGVYRPLKKDRVWLLVNAEPEFNTAGSLDHIICTFNNFTEQIFTRKKLKENEDNLIALNAILEAKTVALTNKNIELESFAYVASHDLQEPLRMVSGFIKLFEKKYENIVDETGKKYIQFAVDGAERMKTLINNLLKYALITKERETVTDVDMNAVVKEVLYTFSSDGNHTEREIDVEKLPVIQAGKNDMLQLMQNLIGNALKYATDERQVIRISGTETATEYTISVQDNGIGIDPKDSERIFIMFQRLVTQDKFSGTGIGLATCKKIVELYGGKIWVESELGKGSDFKFSIPKKQAV
jgi:signal transduction histidine kinase